MDNTAGLIQRCIHHRIPLVRNSLLRDSAIATSFILIGKSAGFLVPFLIASWFGAGTETDAFFFAYGALLFLAGVFGPVLETIVPYAAEARNRSYELAEFMSRLLICGTAVLGVTLICFELLAVPLIAHVTRFSPYGIKLTRRLLIEASPLPLLLFWTSILSGYLNAHTRFALPALSPAVRAAANLCLIFHFKNHLGIHALPLGYIAGESIRLIALVAAVGRYCPFQFRPVFHLDVRFREFCRTSFHAMGSMIWVLVNPLTDSAMASWLAPGSVTMLQYASNLYQIPLSLFSGGIIVVLLSHWSNRHRISGTEEFRQDIHRGVRWTFWLTLPAAIILILLSPSLSRLLLAHGAFASSNVALIAQIWSAYLLGFPLQAVTQIYVKGLLVQRKTNSLLSGAFYAVFINILGNVILARWLGVPGIAWSTTLAAAFSLLYFRHSLRSILVRPASALGDSDATATN